jgi:hypothetical protein
MLAILLLLTSTFATEAASSIGKQSIRYRRENVYDLVFLEVFWGLVFILGTLAFGARFHFDPHHCRRSFHACCSKHPRVCEC